MAFYLSCTTICSVCTQFNPWYVAPIQLLFSWDERVGTMAPSAYRTDEIQPDDAANGHAGTVAPLVLASSDRFFLFVRCLAGAP